MQPRRADEPDRPRLSRRVSGPFIPPSLPTNIIGALIAERQ
jgi:hypothetical protein